MWLIGDVGGSKTDLALVDPARASAGFQYRKRLQSADFESLSALVRAFLRDIPARPTRGCFAVAGPIRPGPQGQGIVELTNLPWNEDEHRLAADLELEAVLLMNDLEAIAAALPFLLPQERITLSPGRPDPAGTLAVVAPGTGLGEAYLTWSGDRYHAHPAEGGHADFAPESDDSLGVWRMLQKRYGHVSVERACSGIGIGNLYEYLAGTGRYTELPELAARLAAADDKVPLIVDAGLDPAAPSALCRAALQLFADHLAAEAGNFGLKLLATGGIFLAGGMPPRVLPLLQTDRFLERVRAKGRMTQVVAEMPLHVVTGRVALRGAAAALGTRAGWSPAEIRERLSHGGTQ